MSRRPRRDEQRRARERGKGCDAFPVYAKLGVP